MAREVRTTIHGVTAAERDTELAVVIAAGLASQGQVIRDPADIASDAMKILNRIKAEVRKG